MLYLFSMLIFFAGSANLYAGMHTEIVEYRHGDTMLEGYLAYDDEVKGVRPAVLVVHDWLGVGPYVKKRTEELAKLGYIAFAIDMYGKGVRPENA
ncbi:MAG: dienelactone hydrolase family protein, partial [Nitrospirota bacterium]